MLPQIVPQIIRTVKLQVIIYTNYIDPKGRVAFEATGIDAYDKVVQWMAKQMGHFFYYPSVQQWELKSVTEVSYVA